MHFVVEFCAAEPSLLALPKLYICAARLHLLSVWGKALAYYARIFQCKEVECLKYLTQARLTVPVLLVTLAVTPPFLLRPMPAGGSLAPQDSRRDRTPVWQVKFLHLMLQRLPLKREPDAPFLLLLKKDITEFPLNTALLPPFFQCFCRGLRVCHTLSARKSSWQQDMVPSAGQPMVLSGCTCSLQNLLTDSSYRMRAQGLVQAAGVALAVLHARYALFEILQRAIGGRPTEAVLLGCLLLGVAAGCAPIVAFQYSDSVRARRWMAFLAAAGALLVMLRPPLPTKVRYICLGSYLVLRSHQTSLL